MKESAVAIDKMAVPALLLLVSIVVSVCDDSCECSCHVKYELSAAQ